LSDVNQLNFTELFLNLSSELNNEGDRTVAVLLAAHLDYLLESLVATNLAVDADEVRDLLLKGGNAPLTTFSSRINAAYCFGLLSKDEWRDLHQIRDVRNKFAHQLVGISLSSTSIADKCRSLKLSQVNESVKDPRACLIKAGVRLMVTISIRISNKNHVLNPDSDYGIEETHV